MRLLVAIALGLSISGCAVSGAVVDAGIDRAERASGEMTQRSLDWICNRLSVRQWRESIAIDKERIAAWYQLCVRVPIPPGPPTAPELGPPEPLRPRV